MTYFFKARLLFSTKYNCTDPCLILCKVHQNQISSFKKVQIGVHIKTMDQWMDKCHTMSSSLGLGWGVLKLTKMVTSKYWQLVYAEFFSFSNHLFKYKFKPKFNMVRHMFLQVIIKLANISIFSTCHGRGDSLHVHPEMYRREDTAFPGLILQLAVMCNSSKHSVHASCNIYLLPCLANFQSLREKE